MADASAHRGIAEDDPRNRGPIAFFAPQDVTVERAREMLTRAMPRATPSEVERRVGELMARMAEKPPRSPQPLSQPIAAVADPFYELGVHPDLVERLWHLDDALPQRCRWVFWGRPSLVHPATGVVFAVAIGTIGLVMRLPPHVLRQAAPDKAAIVIRGNPGQTFDIAPAGPEWRFAGWSASEIEWCRAAYDFAAAAAD